MARYPPQRRLARVRKAKQEPVGVEGQERFRRLVEDRCRHEFRMSLDEFLREFRAGRFNDRPAAFDLALLVGGARH